MNAVGTGNVPYKINFGDINSFYGTERVAYCRAKIWSDRDEKVLVELGSDDGAKVWVDGKIFHSNNTLRGYSPGADKFKVDLKKGSNDMLVKITQSTAGWEFSIRFRTEDGKSSVKGLKYSLD